MATKESENALQIRRTYPASRQKVFEAWTQPEQLMKWFAPSEQYNTSVLELNVRPGGRYRIQMIDPDGKVHTVFGTYQEVDAPRKLVFTWKWESDEVWDSLVTLEFFENAGSTELVLTHQNLPTDKLRDEHRHGWDGCLVQLGKFL